MALLNLATHPPVSTSSFLNYTQDSRFEFGLWEKGGKGFEVVSKDQDGSRSMLRKTLENYRPAGAMHVADPEAVQLACGTRRRKDNEGQKGLQLSVLESTVYRWPDHTGVDAGDASSGP